MSLVGRALLEISERTLDLLDLTGRDRDGWERKWFLREPDPEPLWSVEWASCEDDDCEDGDDCGNDDGDSRDGDDNDVYYDAMNNDNTTKMSWCRFAYKPTRDYIRHYN